MTLAIHERDRPALVDDAVAVDVLLGHEAVGLLDAVVGPAGGTVGKVVPRQATYTPGQSLTVHYEVGVSWTDRPRTTELLVATTGGRIPSQALHLSDGTHRIGAWRVPNDPRLPGLPAALDPRQACGRLAELGADVPDARTRLRAYRPGRRAVIEVAGPGVRLFLKVVRPHRAEALHRTHRMLEQHAPVPRSLGWSPDHGVVALQALPGHTLRDGLTHRRPLPAPAAHLALLDMRPVPPLDAPAANGWQVERFATLISATNPELADRVGRLADALLTAEHRRHAEPVVATHGDYHEAQVMIDGGRLSGLLDVDTFGWGHRVDDLAAMIGHLSTLAIASPRHDHIRRHAAQLMATFDQQIDPVLMRYAVAAVVLGMATGPFRVLEPGWRRNTEARIALAERWVDSARSLATGPTTPHRRGATHERGLTALSPAAQVPAAS